MKNTVRNDRANYKFPQKFLSWQVPLCLYSPITRLPFPNSPDDSVPNLIYGLRCGVRCRPNLSISITRDALTRLAALERNCPLRFFLKGEVARRGRKISTEKRAGNLVRSMRMKIWASSKLAHHLKSISVTMKFIAIFQKETLSQSDKLGVSDRHSSISSELWPVHLKQVSGRSPGSQGRVD